jgi:RND family efflux transporter MFP subunit
MSNEPGSKRLEALRSLQIERRDEPAPTPAAPRRRGPRWGLWIALALVVGAAGGAYATRESWLPARVVSVVEAAAPSDPSGASPVLVAGGYLAAERTTALSPTVSGRLLEVLVDEGDAVLAGQVLARIDDRELRAALDIARAALARARASSAQASAARVTADVALREAEANASRKRTLLEKGVATAADEESAGLGADRARAAQTSAQAAIGSAGAEILQAQANVTAAQLALENAEVRAPFTGTVLERTADPGAIVGPQSPPILTVGQVDRIHVDIDVSEADIAHVRAGMGARVTPDALRDHSFEAKVARISPRADRQKGIVPVRVDIVEHDDALKPGLAAKVLFLEPQGASAAARPAAPLAPRVPRSAVFRSRGHSYVVVVEDGRAKRREVTLGLEVGDDVEVTQGLDAGERVISSGAATIREGERVSVDSG